MSRALSTGEFLCIVDKDGNPIGQDSSSGGYPYVAALPSQIRYWNYKYMKDCVQYHRTINYGDKGYRIQRIVVNPPEDLPSHNNPRSGQSEEN